MAVRVTGVEELRKLAVDLRAAGNPAKGLRKSLRRNIIAAVTPMQKEIQAGYRSLPSHSGAGARDASGKYVRDTRGRFATSGLREALARATRISFLTGARTVGVRLTVDGTKMPGQDALPEYVEGTAGRPWRHPGWGNRRYWYAQAATPVVGPIVDANVSTIQFAVTAAVDEVVAKFEKGNFS